MLSGIYSACSATYVVLLFDYLIYSIKLSACNSSVFLGISSFVSSYYYALSFPSAAASSSSLNGSFGGPSSGSSAGLSSSGGSCGYCADSFALISSHVTWSSSGAANYYDYANAPPI